MGLHTAQLCDALPAAPQGSHLLVTPRTLTIKPSAGRLIAISEAIDDFSTRWILGEVHDIQMLTLLGYNCKI